VLGFGHHFIGDSVDVGDARRNRTLRVYQGGKSFGDLAVHEPQEGNFHQPVAVNRIKAARLGVGGDERPQRV
jgi:hypothetical protein